MSQTGRWDIKVHVGWGVGEGDGWMDGWWMGELIIKFFFEVLWNWHGCLFFYLKLAPIIHSTKFDRQTGPTPSLIQAMIHKKQQTY